MYKWRAPALAAVVLLIAFVTPGPSYSAQTNASLPDERKPNPGIYLAPNEQHPAVALPIYRKSNHGAYVSVGTERSFIGAALTEAQALVVIDYDPQTVQFANINRALLAASTGREDYVSLRLQASLDVWQQRARLLTGEDKTILSDPDSWTFWDQKVRKNVWAWGGAFQHFDTEPKDPNDPFYASDYLFDARLYEHLSRLAKHSLIWARVVDLRHDAEVRSVCADLKSRGLPLGVVDTSDVPNASEAGTAVTAQYVKLFSIYAQDSTLFLNTAPTKKTGVFWSYFAFTNKTIRGHDRATIKRWYDKELAKIAADDHMRAWLDDPDVIGR